MIPTFLVRRFGPELAKLIFWLVVILLVVALLGVAKCTYDQGGKTRAKVQAGQTEAAVDSGKDAVNTISNTQAREEQTKTQVQEGIDEINAAPAGNSNDAALRATCRMRSYRSLPRCVALLGPAAK